jgi:hypothetical protein
LRKQASQPGAEKNRIFDSHHSLVCCLGVDSGAGYWRGVQRLMFGARGWLHNCHEFGG